MNKLRSDELGAGIPEGRGQRVSCTWFPILREADYGWEFIAVGSS